MTLAAATDGNHGRAVAHMAALLGFEARIYVPAGTAQARIDGIASEGARFVVVNGTYDDAVARAAEDASERCLVISDTSWPGYEEVPRWVMEGYSTILWEVDDELMRRGDEGPDLVAVQVGVGALGRSRRAALSPDRSRSAAQIAQRRTLHAACMLASMEAGEIVSVAGPHDSIMAGLNCGRPSIIAWPTSLPGSTLSSRFLMSAREKRCECWRRGSYRGRNRSGGTCRDHRIAHRAREGGASRKARGQRRHMHSVSSSPRVRLIRRPIARSFAPAVVRAKMKPRKGQNLCYSHEWQKHQVRPFHVGLQTSSRRN